MYTTQDLPIHLPQEVPPVLQHEYITIFLPKLSFQEFTIPLFPVSLFHEGLSIFKLSWGERGACLGFFFKLVCFGVFFS